MTNIPKISSESAVGKVDRRQPATPQSPTDVRTDESSKANKQSDLLQVDHQRQHENRLEENAKLLLGELPEKRADKIAQARSRLESGFYDRPEILEKTAGKILKDSINAAPLQISGEENSAVNSDRVNNSRRRLASGYYEQQEVLEETARRIIKKNLKT